MNIFRFRSTVNDGVTSRSDRKVLRNGVSKGKIISYTSVQDKVEVETWMDAKVEV